MASANVRRCSCESSPFTPWRITSHRCCRSTSPSISASSHGSHREGRIILVPFGYGYPTLVDRLWDYTTDMVLYFPVGVLAVLGWTSAGQRRRPASAMALGVAFVAFVQFCQVFIYSRYADATDLITGSAGIALGIAAVARLSRGVSSSEPASDHRRLWAAFGSLVWLGALLVYHWFPFDFVVTGEMLAQRWPMLVAVPFRSYYFGSELPRVTECRASS